MKVLLTAQDIREFFDAEIEDQFQLEDQFQHNIYSNVEDFLHDYKFENWARMDDYILAEFWNCAFFDKNPCSKMIIVVDEKLNEVPFYKYIEENFEQLCKYIEKKAKEVWKK